MPTCGNGSLPKRRGRPPGRQHDTILHIRLPKATVKALKQLARRGRVSMSAVVRSGVLASMAQAVAPLVAVAKNEQMSGRRRIEALRVLRLYATACMHLSPHGRELARQRAAFQ